MDKLTKFKTKPLAHQLECYTEYGRREYFALLAEQGTGKTWIIINNAADLWASKELNGLLVFAPSGVHYNWVLREIPLHMPDWCRRVCVAWDAGANKEDEKAINAVLNETDASILRIFVMNVEALQTKRGVEVARRFALSCSSLMIVADESEAFKNPSAVRTKELMSLRAYSRWRRIMTGTAISEGPFDAFAQFGFLDPSILGTTSYYAFKAEYAEMIPQSHPLIRNIMKKNALRFAPQITERGADGRPRYRNLDKLSALIAPHSFRVLKKDCLDLPEKIRKYVWFDLTREQEVVYRKARDDNRLALNGEDTPFNKLVAQMKLMQITSGYYLHPDCDEPVRIDGRNPKLELLTERAVALVESGEKLIIWARFRVQIEDIYKSLSEKNLRVVQYHGGIKKRDRNEVIENFERGDAQVFIGQQQAGGRGLTIIAAANVFYFSNLHSLTMRLQSEDRAHRIGQLRNVIYTDFCARNTIDFECLAALESKTTVADAVMGPLSRKRKTQ